MPAAAAAVNGPGACDVADLRARLEQSGQAHLLRFWPELDEQQRRRLHDDLRAVDFGRLAVHFQRALRLSESGEKLDARMRPMPADCHDSSVALAPDDARLAAWRRRGLELVAAGHVAVLLLAGGQGTRLGVSYPKGMYDTGLASHKSLYQLQAERIRALQTLAQQQAGAGRSATLPWYIMTSEATREQTLEFFESHHYFGLDPRNVVMFEQNTIPSLDLSGRVLLESKSHIARSPDGNGGVYSALCTSGVLDDMLQRGVKAVHVYGVDNILVLPGDPVFVGFCHTKGAECGNKVVAKAVPTEPVGVLCMVDNHFQVVEYSEISPETAARANADGSLVYNAGNIVNHYFTVDFLRRIVTHHLDDLPYHVARKKIPHIGDDGRVQVPSAPNGIKMELFVFDVFPFASKVAVLEVERSREFSPLKNAPGAAQFTPETARADLLALHRRYIEASGGTLLPGVEVEISPLVSYAGENLHKRCRGRTFAQSTVLE